MDMENRIAVLEREVQAIKSDLAAIKRDHVGANELNARLQRVDFELTQLQKSVTQLTADVAQLKEEGGLIRIELTRLSTLQADCATKAGLIGVQAKVKQVEANMTGWAGDHAIAHDFCFRDCLSLVQSAEADGCGKVGGGAGGTGAANRRALAPVNADAK